MGLDERRVRREMLVEECTAELSIVAPGFYPPGTSGQTLTTSQGGRASWRGFWLKRTTAGFELKTSAHIRRHLGCSKLHVID